MAKPGTAIMVKEGTYTENVDLLGRSGTADKPIWIVSADGKGAANIVAASADKPVLLGYGVSNLVIKGFELIGGTEGIKLTQSGNTLTKLVNSVVIEDNIVHGQSIDGIKTAQSVNTAIVGNTVYNVSSQEGSTTFTCEMASSPTTKSTTFGDCPASSSRLARQTSRS